MNYPIGQHFIAGFDGTTVTPEVKELIRGYKIGGFILFRRNIENVKQVKELIGKIQKLSKTPLFMGVDQEGGSVFRLGAPFTVLPHMSLVGDYYRKTRQTKLIKDLGRILGSELKAVGFNWDYAPVVDVHSNPKNPIIGKRSFSPDPLVVTNCVKALMKGLHQEGVLSCAKHFPGHGMTSVDSHLALPIVDDPTRLMWKRDLVPYRKLIAQNSLPAVMTAHVRYPEWDPHYPATLSRPILTHLLRGRLGFKGVVISDDLWMKAVSEKYGISEATRLFFEAGGDIAMICKEPASTMESMDLMAKVIKHDREMIAEMKESAARIKKLRKKFCTTTKLPSLEVIGCPEHAKVLQVLAKALPQRSKGE
jgi:beta-N-acetylhexosaminidase